MVTAKVQQNSQGFKRLPKNIRDITYVGVLLMYDESSIEIKIYSHNECYISLLAVSERTNQIAYIH